MAEDIDVLYKICFDRAPDDPRYAIAAAIIEVAVTLNGDGPVVYVLGKIADTLSDGLSTIAHTMPD